MLRGLAKVRCIMGTRHASSNVATTSTTEGSQSKLFGTLPAPGQSEAAGATTSSSGDDDLRTMPPRQPIPFDVYRRLFPAKQVATWPIGYRPTPSVAHFLRPEGVPLQEVIEAREDLRDEGRKQPQADDAGSILHRDLATDYNLWTRCRFEMLCREVKESHVAAPTP